MKRQPRSLNQLERAVLAAVEKAGASGLVDADADHIFRKRIPRDKRVQLFRKLEGLGLITPSRSPGGGTVWRKHERREPRAAKDEREPDDPKNLRAYFCKPWPSLSVGAEVKFHDGFFATADTALQKAIESCHGYGLQITCVSGEEAAAAVEAAEKAAKGRSDSGVTVAIHS